MKNNKLNNIVSELQLRSKELNCLYITEETLRRPGITLEEVCNTIVENLPNSFLYSRSAACKIRLTTSEYASPNYKNTEWRVSSEIMLRGRRIGYISVNYLSEMPSAEIGPFLKVEKALVEQIAEKLVNFIQHEKLRSVFSDLGKVENSTDEHGGEKWKAILEMLRKTDTSLYQRILRKLLHHLCWSGIAEAYSVMKAITIDIDQSIGSSTKYDNKPLKKRPINKREFVDAIIDLCTRYLTEDEILAKIDKWIQQDKAGWILKVAEGSESSLNELGDALRTFHNLIPDDLELANSISKGLKVSLIRRYFTDKLDYLNTAKDYLEYQDFFELIERIILPPKSHGKMGGKSSGLFLSYNIIKKQMDYEELLADVKIPKTWYIASDAIMYFLRYNSLEEVIEQKYKQLEEVRLEYPHIVQVFKNSQFPPELMEGLADALEDFGDTPIIVRSSSLLEDQTGAAFSGKYKSLFLANQGTEEEKLDALMDAVAEVYASLFSPDPIEYRAERGLIDFHEEMGIMIQEVVGKKAGKYFFPAFAGVAFSSNEFRWSPRIKREDGLLRLVPGLGTRAVDRLSDDYPILVSPGQPNLRVNVSIQDRVRYSPSKIDVINLSTNEFETKSIEDLIHEIKEEFPSAEKVFSKFESNYLRQTNIFNIDFEKDKLVATLDGVIEKSIIIKKIGLILETLHSKIGSPIDIEFAYNGDSFYLLQSRPQSYSADKVADSIPKDVAKEKILFSANRYVSNGRVPDITHIVYVDPQKYYELPSKEDLISVGRIVGKLNKLLPKRKFILMGPGRWGSRGDIKLGVSVTYSDINNAAVLIEIAQKKGNYTPDLSFGTHFFQDLVEANIRYLPLYPDDPGVEFNYRFFSLYNHMDQVAPELDSMKEVVRVIDVTQATNGKILKVLFNAESDSALGLITDPSKKEFIEAPKPKKKKILKGRDQWTWRYRMAEKLALEVDTEKYGVKNIYIFGSSKNETARPDSDIDLIVHISEDEAKRNMLDIWFEGWSLSLAEINYLRTGYNMEGGLLDIHYITDRDINERTTYARKINSKIDAPKRLKLK